MALSNDARGWIMTCISGVACVLGASIICADIIIRRFPGKKNFRIQDSDVFLSSSLSLSFGVMLFSSLYSMLPSAKSSLQNGGFSPKAAAWILIGCFLAGAGGIQIVSRVLHHFMPSHTVDCEHTHEDEDDKGTQPTHDHGDNTGDHEHHHHDQPHRHVGRSQSHRPRWQSQKKSSADQPSFFVEGAGQSSSTLAVEPHDARSKDAPGRPSLQARLTSTISQLTHGSKSACDGDGPCYGFSDPCGQECFKIVQSRGSMRTLSHRSFLRPHPGRSATAPLHPQMTEATPLLRNINEDSAASSNTSPSKEPQSLRRGSETAVSTTSADADVERDGDTPGQQHHHHVPTNAFLSIGLQTSIAIALHKLPEGFITYATNHANPSLGFAVFLALFIHNITEGFAMALPLYLAINSRWKAMFWSSLLGGFTQPFGAGIAAIWFKLAGKGDMAPGEGVYGIMFAITAGIMASVALQLFSESLDLTHNRGLCMIFAFVGMGILGISSALTA